jgi:translation initiation factor IF-1
VRPESVRLEPEPDGPATVATVSFLGALSRVTVSLADGTEVLAQTGSDMAARLGIGDRVRVELAPTPVLVIARGTGGPAEETASRPDQAAPTAPGVAPAVTGLDQ